MKHSPYVEKITTAFGNQQFYSVPVSVQCFKWERIYLKGWHLLGPGKGFKLYACFDCTVAASKVSAVLQNDYDGIIKAYSSGLGVATAITEHAH